MEYKNPNSSASTKSGSRREVVHSKFFTNHLGNTLFEKFKGIIEGMQNLHSFHAVVGYFRSSGYFKIRKELCDTQNKTKIQILVGINIDNIFRRHNKSLLFLAGEKVSDEAREQYRRDFIEDVRSAGYYKDIEQGIGIPNFTRTKGWEIL
ncbi:MAG: hypothetical protein SNI12_08430 [Rikenellaceae bacterium]